MTTVVIEASLAGMLLLGVMVVASSRQIQRRLGPDRGNTGYTVLFTVGGLLLWDSAKDLSPEIGGAQAYAVTFGPIVAAVAVLAVVNRRRRTPVLLATPPRKRRHA